MGTAIASLDLEAGVTQLAPKPNPVEHYLELAMRGDLGEFQAGMGNHLLGITAGHDVYEDRSPLHMAALHGRVDVVKLIMASPDVSSQVVNARDRFGYTPLHLAVRSEHVDVVRILAISSLTRLVTASSQQDDEGQDCDGFTPLHVAAMVGNIAIVKLILQELVSQERPINIHATNWQGTTALDIAKQRTHAKLVDILECWDVNWLLLERQQSANSVNAILVGAALVATVTLGCLLQPPYVDKNATSLAFDQWKNRMAMGWFLVSTLFSFTFSIVSLVIGTTASIRPSYVSLKSEVHQLRRSVLQASIFLFVAIFFLILTSLQGTKQVYLQLVSGPPRGWVFTFTQMVLPIACLGFVFTHIVIPKGTAKGIKFLIGSFVIVAFVFGVAIYCATGTEMFEN